MSNFVLIHGGMIGGNCWKKVRKSLEERNHAAVLPTSGESMFDAVGPEISSFLHNSAQKENGWQVPAGTPQSYGIKACEDVKWFNNMSTPHPLKSFQQKLYFKTASFKKLNKLYVKCSQDLALDFMATRAKNMKIPCFEIDTGHFLMLTDSEAIVDLLIREW